VPAAARRSGSVVRAAPTDALAGAVRASPWPAGAGMPIAGAAVGANDAAAGRLGGAARGRPPTPGTAAPTCRHYVDRATPGQAAGAACHRWFAPGPREPFVTSLAGHPGSSGPSLARGAARRLVRGHDGALRTSSRRRARRDLSDKARPRPPAGADRSLASPEPGRGNARDRCRLEKDIIAPGSQARL
jgi:hypothetical protein